MLGQGGSIKPINGGKTFWVIITYAGMSKYTGNREDHCNYIRNGLELTVWSVHVTSDVHQGSQSVTQLTRTLES